MDYGKITKFQSGVAVPLFSLISHDSVGIGEFPDLLLLGAWVKQCKMNLIQLLPVNDTGLESSPYSALSAFALNPVFLRIQDLADAKIVLTEVDVIKKEFSDPNHTVAYQSIYKHKQALLQKIYQKNQSKILKSKKILKWVEENGHWIKTYSVYKFLKEQNELKSWREWSSLVHPTPAKIDLQWARHFPETFFYAWVQYECEQQFLFVVQKLDEMGVRIKGDIPILINEDSADVWGERKYFHLDFRAGAPPDMFSYTGQNWGFPTYNWTALKKSSYEWWVKRLQQSEKFYHAYRIDHVLGFFRIWRIHQKENTGIFGHFFPGVHITRAKLHEVGFNDSLIDFLAYPAFPAHILHEKLGEHYDHVLGQCFVAHPADAHMYYLKPDLQSEKLLEQLDLPTDAKERLKQIYWERVLIPGENHDEFHFYWYFYNTLVFQYLGQWEQDVLHRLSREISVQQDALWKSQGESLLKMMCKATKMLVCAEDLGVIPNCVPDVLADLGILSLRIERWARKWNEAYQPYIHPREYPRLSVCTTSCHDSTTLRGWWSESVEERNQYHQYHNFEGVPEDQLTNLKAYTILKRLMDSNSLLAVIPMQDWFSLHADYCVQTPNQERVNVPATLDATNWAWRVPFYLEDLLQAAPLNDLVSKLCALRQARTVK
jgi:4-alpha-glucanotransferase